MEKIELSLAEAFALQEAMASVGYLNFEDAVKKAVFISVNEKISNILSKEEND